MQSKLKKKENLLLLMIWMLTCLLIKNSIQYNWLFIRGTKLNISLVFITQYYFAVSKNVILNSTHCFIMKFPNKREVQQIPFNRLSDIDFKDFMNLNKNCTAKPYSFLFMDAPLASDNLSCFRKNLLERI